MKYYKICYLSKNESMYMFLSLSLPLSLLYLNASYPLFQRVCLIIFTLKLNSLLQVLSGHPTSDGGRGIYILNFMKNMTPNLCNELLELWDTVIPKLIAYIEGDTYFINYLLSHTQYSSYLLWCLCIYMTTRMLCHYLGHYSLSLMVKLSGK